MRDRHRTSPNRPIFGGSAALLAMLAVSGLAGSPSAMAGGLYINEFASPSMGLAGAGAQALAEDASTAFHNPAGMTRLEGHQLMMGLGGVASSIEFDPDGAGDDGGDQGGFGPILGTYYVHDLSERFKVGASLNAISAAVLDPDDDWVGASFLTELDILIMEFAPSAAWKVTDWLSVGASPRLAYAVLNQDVKPNPATGIELEDVDDFEAGWNAGLLLEPRPGTRIGLLYVSELELDLSGDIDLALGGFGGSAAIDTELVLPQLVRLGLYHELTDRLALTTSVGWEDWSELDDQFVSVSALPGAGAIPRKWSDTYYAAVGLRWRPRNRWLVQAGFAYDSSPVKARDRTPDLPIDRQLRYAVGVQHQWSEELNVGVSFVYADYGKAKIRNDTLTGEYDRQDLFFLTLNLNWKGVPWRNWGRLEAQ